MTFLQHLLGTNALLAVTATLLWVTVRVLRQGRLALPPSSLKHLAYALTLLSLAMPWILPASNFANPQWSAVQVWSAATMKGYSSGRQTLPSIQLLAGPTVQLPQLAYAAWAETAVLSGLAVALIVWIFRIAALRRFL